MTRKEQIEKARWDLHVPQSDIFFMMGAEWADANPKDPRISDLMYENVLECLKLLEPFEVPGHPNTLVAMVRMVTEKLKLK